VVYPTTMGAFTVGVVPVDSRCWSFGEILVDACLAARSGDKSGLTVADDFQRDAIV
jgi:hypothetical protein